MTAEERLTMINRAQGYINTAAKSLNEAIENMEYEKLPILMLNIEEAAQMGFINAHFLHNRDRE